MHNEDMWMFLAGIGFFLFGMSQLESVLKNTSGRSFKLFLKRNTQSLFKSILGGAFVTGIVQSSSVVSLILLAFVESGIITFRNALGVMLGANLGTTLNSWIVASIGFKLDVLSFSLPIIAITATGMFFFEKRRNLYHLFLAFFALGILFLGLGFMKEGALGLVKDFDIKTFAHYNLFIFVLIGFVLTSIIQSSSATVAITLTAIYSGVISFPSAAAVVIGSEIGTTIKILLWGMKGSAEKNRVALGNFIYNIFTAVMAFIFLHSIIYCIENIFRINDPLIGLALFQTSINLLSIILFLPFLNIFSRWLDNKFVGDKENGNSYISKNLPLLPILAPEAMKNETKNLLVKTLQFNKSILCSQKLQSESLLENIKSLTQAFASIEVEYDRLKKTEGDILAYYALNQDNNLEKTDATLMLQYVNAARQLIYAAKSVKDIEHNLREFEASHNDFLHQQRALIHSEWSTFDYQYNNLLTKPDKSQIVTDIEALKTIVLIEEDMHKSEFIARLKNNELNEMEASTLLNVYRELLSCQKSLLLSLKEIESE